MSDSGLYFPSCLCPLPSHASLLPEGEPGCPAPPALVAGFQSARTTSYLLQPGLLRKFLPCSAAAPSAKSDRTRWGTSEVEQGEGGQISCRGVLFIVLRGRTPECFSQNWSVWGLLVSSVKSKPSWDDCRNICWSRGCRSVPAAPDCPFWHPSSRQKVLLHRVQIHSQAVILLFQANLSWNNRLPVSSIQLWLFCILFWVSLLYSRLVIAIFLVRIILH